ncbi:uncharacterized protein LOC117321475 [Pecten maximus]|uniref:uncharacterized protein LOC117321475 n=1 Tax=Pecten maximus TaxID=6579 RepID=UPI001458F8C4|nr:uncharacterized protein LOC117321475 [Pecten maximus]
MVHTCVVYGCTNRADNSTKRGFYGFPTVRLHEDKRAGKKERNGSPPKEERASRRKPAKSFDKLNPDWVPSLKLTGKEQTSSVTSSSSKRFHRTNQRQNKRQQLIAARALIDLSVSASTCTIEEDEQTSSEGNLKKVQFLKLGIVRSETQGSEELKSRQREELLRNYMAECQERTTENVSLKQQLLDGLAFSEDALRGNDKKISFLTGLPGFLTLMTVFDFIKDDIPESWKLRKCISWPQREELRMSMPMEFRKHFGLKVAVVIDCFEFFTKRPSDLLARAKSWSCYKHHNTIKFLIGIAPQGAITYLSRAWGGRVSDKYIVENSDFLDKLIPGDVVLADRGFDIQDSVGLMCADVKIPSFTKGKSQLSPLELESTRNIAHVRIHVEGVIGLVRNKYTILSEAIPVDYLIAPEGDVTTVDKIVTVAV